ncbi:PfkB family carbohydrate kinase [Actinoplanes sp. NPDC051633]|uniref:PfkB family carbohydrate kinase n=1 Tax=Actinoplanes sp. NPDC051633 TaxID=3155670 RepID=UPI00341618B9
MKITCVGLSTVDIVYRVPRIPGADEKAQATSVEVAAGGPALNAAVTAAALGARVTLVTAVGSHPLGELIRSDLDGYGVRLVDAAESSAPPPISAVTVEEDSGRRTIVSRNAGDVAVRVPDDLDLDGVVLVDGHHPALADVAARGAGRLVVDAGHWRPVFATILPHASVVACSAGFRLPPSVGDLSTVAPDVAVTDGPHPVRWWSGAASGSLDVPTVAAVDTAGAGDAFHGALAVALASGASFTDALREAIRVAAIRVRHRGPRSWLSDPGLTSEQW